MLVHRHILLAEMHGLLLKIDLGLLDEDVDSPSREGDEKRCGRRTGKQLRRPAIHMWPDGESYTGEPARPLAKGHLTILCHHHLR